MTDALYISLEGFGIIILFLMTINFGSGDAHRLETDDRIFTGMLWVNLALLAMDLSTWLLNGRQFVGARALNLLTTAFYYALHPVMCLLWLLYCEYKLTGDRRRLKRRLPLYALPLAAAELLTAASCFHKLVFTVDADNLYARGPLYVPFVALTFGYFLYTYVLLLRALRRERAAAKRREIRFLFLYPLFPIVSAVVQSFCFGLAIIWTSSVVSLLILYFNLQNAQITTDALTGINNRRRFESYIDAKLSGRRRMPMLFLLMIDINHFKSINDRFGHLAGDGAIRRTAQLIVHAVRRDDFVARIGGDEFVVVGERENEAEMLRAAQAIEQAIAAFDRDGGAAYELSVSIGCSFAHEWQNKTADELISEADAAMYLQKQACRGTK